MLLGCVTYNVLRDMDLETVIKTLEATGYDAVELRTTHRHGVEPGLSAEERRQVRGRFGRSGVRLLSYGTTCEFQSPEAAERRRQVETGRQFVDLAHDTGAWGVKVRPNGFPEGAPRAETVKRIATALGELGEYGEGRGVEIWLEVHGKGTEEPAVCAEILRATGHRSVGICWNSNPADVVDGSVKPSFELLKTWIRSVHINDLSNSYPWRELFGLLKGAGYERYTLCETAESKEPERFLRYYRALWRELQR